jgi:hypothetical protein
MIHCIIQHISTYIGICGIFKPCLLLACVSNPNHTWRLITQTIMCTSVFSLSVKTSIKSETLIYLRFGNPIEYM